VSSGLAQQRTSLAWTRSALAILAIGAALVKAAWEARAPVLVAASAAVLLVLAGLVWWAGEREDRRRRTGTGPAAARASRPLLLLLPVASVISALMALAVALSTGH